MNNASAALTMTDLRIEVRGRGVDIVDDVDIVIQPGQVLGLVGESGSGKTTVGLAALGHTRRGVEIAGGTIIIDGQDVRSLDEPGLRRLRGSEVSYVPQDPGAALNPALRIGKQIVEILEAHNFGDDAARRQRALEVMSEVLLPSTPAFLKRYPHQLSGGQQQRVGLAMAFACRPSVIVLDEPTTGLDVSTQAHVLTTVRQLCQQHGVAALYVTHDLAVVANLADRVAVMYAGRIIEQGTAQELFFNPAHPYTRHLIAAAPDMETDHEMVGLRGRAPAPGRRPIGCSFALRCELVTAECMAAFPAETEVGVGRVVRCIKPFEVPQRTQHVSVHSSPIAASATHALMLRDVCASYTGLQVVHHVDLHVDRGECLALVGESGSGKTTLSRSIGGLHREWTGEILLGSERLAPSARDRTTAQRLRIQYVFQNPYSSLQPRRTVGDS